MSNLNQFEKPLHDGGCRRSLITRATWMCSRQTGQVGSRSRHGVRGCKAVARRHRGHISSNGTSGQECGKEAMLKGLSKPAALLRICSNRLKGSGRQSNTVSSDRASSRFKSRHTSKTRRRATTRTLARVSTRQSSLQCLSHLKPVDHSVRSACMGSFEAARRAGINPATSAQAARSAAAKITLAGSWLLTP